MDEDTTAEVTIEGCRVHPGKVTSCHELCACCYNRVSKAVNRWCLRKPPTALQAVTLRGMGRPTAKLLKRYPKLPEIIEVAKLVPPPAPKTPRVIEAAPVAVVPSGPEQTEAPRQAGRPVDLGDLVSRLRTQADLGELALDLSRPDYRVMLSTQMSRVVLQGVEGAAYDQALPLVDRAICSTLEGLSAELAGLLSALMGTGEGE